MTEISVKKPCLRIRLQATEKLVLCELLEIEYSMMVKKGRPV